MLTKTDNPVFAANGNERLRTLTAALRGFGDLLSFFDGDLNLVNKEGLGCLCEILAAECETSRLQVLEERGMNDSAEFIKAHVGEGL